MLAEMTCTVHLLLVHRQQSRCHRRLNRNNRHSQESLNKLGINSQTDQLTLVQLYTDILHGNSGSGKRCDANHKDELKVTLKLKKFMNDQTEQTHHPRRGCADTNTCTT